MLINGQPFSNWDDWDDPNVWNTLLDALQSLPSGFHQRTARAFERIEPKPGTPAFQLEMAAYEAISEFEDAPEDNTLFEKSLAALEQCIAENEEAGNIIKQANFLQMCGEVCNDKGDGERAIYYLEKSLAIFKTLEAFDDQFGVLGELHRATRIAVAEADQSEAVERLTRKLRDVRRELVDVNLRTENTAIEPAAFRVEQGEVGFSSEELIGTDNVQECLTVVVLHSGKVGVAHIDRNNDASSLDRVFQHMPESSPDNPLQVMLLGARYDQEDLQGFERSKGNIQKVMDFLKNKNVDIKAASVMKDGQPRSIVVNPKTFEIREANPWRRDRNSHLGMALLDINAEPRPLHVAFDLTESKQRAPILLSAQQVSDLYIKGKNEAEWYAFEESYARSAESNVAITVDSHVTVAESHQQSVDYLKKCLKEKIDSLKDSERIRATVEIDEDEVKAVEESLAEIAIHIGDGADEANQPLVDFIQKPNRLIEMEQVGESKFIARFKPEKLHNVLLPQQPFEAIKAKARVSREPPVLLGKRERSPNLDDGGHVGTKVRK